MDKGEVKKVIDGRAKASNMPTSAFVEEVLVKQSKELGFLKRSQLCTNQNIPEGLLGGAEKGCVVAVSTEAGLGMAIEVRKENLTLEELRENHLVMWENFSQEIVEEENCEVGGVPAIRWRIGDGGLHEVIFGVKGDRWYSLVAPVSDPYWGMFDRIIASFSIEG